MRISEILFVTKKKAYKNKKKVSTTFKFKAKSSSKFLRLAYKEACKAQYGKAYRPDFKITRAMYDGMKDDTYFKATCDCYESWQSRHLKKIKKGVYSYKLVINGKSGSYRKEYRNDDAKRMMINDITYCTEGLDQFDKALVVLAWLQARGAYYCGRNQKHTDYDLLKGQWSGQCDYAANLFASYAKWAGVKNVGVVEDKNHAFNYIVVDGKKYYLDYQQDCNSLGWNGPTTPRDWIRKLSINVDPTWEDKNAEHWDALYRLNKWYKENVDSEAEPVYNCKAIWSKLTAEQKNDFAEEAYLTSYDKLPDMAKYEFNCDSYSKSQILPAKLHMERFGGLDNPKKWSYFAY